MTFDLASLLAEVASDLLSDASYVWVMIFLILTGCGLPIPEEVGIIAAGVWAAEGSMDFGLGLAACLIACIVGDSIMYGIGYRFGKSILREHPMVAGFLTPQREKQIEQMILRRGAIVLFTARFLVGVRGPVYLTSGILHFPYRRFLLIDVVCASIVVTVFYSLAYYFGSEIITWIRKAEEGLTIAVLLAIAVGAVLFWLHHRRGKKMIETLDMATDVLATVASDQGAASGVQKFQGSTNDTAPDDKSNEADAVDDESKARAATQERLPQD
jgi:membrane protein DedA with SNARE-associated domain